MSQLPRERPKERRWYPPDGYRYNRFVGFSTLDTGRFSRIVPFIVIVKESDDVLRISYPSLERAEQMRTKALCINDNSERSKTAEKKEESLPESDEKTIRALRDIALMNMSMLREVLSSALRANTVIGFRNMLRDAKSAIEISFEEKRSYVISVPKILAQFYRISERVSIERTKKEVTSYLTKNPFHIFFVFIREKDNENEKEVGKVTFTYDTVNQVLHIKVEGDVSHNVFNHAFSQYKNRVRLESEQKGAEQTREVLIEMKQDPDNPFIQNLVPLDPKDMEKRQRSEQNEKKENTEQSDQSEQKITMCGRLNGDNLSIENTPLTEKEKETIRKSNSELYVYVWAIEKEAERFMGVLRLHEREEQKKNSDGSAMRDTPL